MQYMKLIVYIFEIIQRRQSRYERPIYAFWELFSDYSAYSTLHGVRYMGEKVNSILKEFKYEASIDVVRRAGDVN